MRSAQRNISIGLKVVGFHPFRIETERSLGVGEDTLVLREFQTGLSAVTENKVVARVLDGAGGWINMCIGMPNSQKVRVRTQTNAWVYRLSAIS